MTTMISWVKRALSKLTGNQISELVKRAARGDREAYGALYLEFADQMYRYIYFKTFQNEVTAQDLTQTVFLKAWNKIGEFEQSGSFKAWLYQIARNTVVDSLRKEKPNGHLKEGITGETRTLEQQMNTIFVKKHVKEALQRLPTDQRELIVLKFIEDLPNSEIAVLLNKSEEAVRAQQSRAFKTLRKALSIYAK